MIVSWITSGPVIARIIRNIRSLDAESQSELPEWIAEAIGKLQTHYQLKLVPYKVNIRFYRGSMPCKKEGLAAVVYNGMRMLPGDPGSPIGQLINNGNDNVFQSVVNFPNSITDIDETDINDWPFYLNTVEALGVMPICQTAVYKMNYDILETNVKDGCLIVYVWEIPKDKNGFPMIPKNENYHTAVYWYCRMMAIGAGWQDPLFDYSGCEVRWEKYARFAINEITYPSPDEKKRNIEINTGLIPRQYDWETFGSLNPESNFIDDL